MGLTKTSGVNGRKNSYELYKDEMIELIDASSIPEPEEMAKLIKRVFIKKE